MLNIDTSWQEFEVRFKDHGNYSSKWISFLDEPLRHAQELELKYKDGKTKKWRQKMFHSILPDEVDEPFRPGHWVYDFVWDAVKRRSKYTNRLEFEDFVKDIVAIRPWGIERSKVLHDKIQVGDIIRFKGTSDSKSWREITDIAVSRDENPFSTQCVGQKITWKKGDKIDHLIREPYMTQNTLNFAVERLIQDGNKFKVEKL